MRTPFPPARVIGVGLVLVASAGRGAAQDGPSELFLKARAEYSARAFDPSTRAIEFEAHIVTRAVADGPGVGPDSCDAIARTAQPDVVKVNYDGKNLVAEAATSVLVRTPYRAFVLYRKGPEEPFSIKALSEVYPDDTHTAELWDTERRIERGWHNLLRPDQIARIPDFTRFQFSITKEAAAPGGRTRFDFSIRPDPTLASLGRPHTVQTTGMGYCLLDPGWNHAMVENAENFTTVGAAGTVGATVTISKKYGYFDADAAMPGMLLKSHRTYTKLTEPNGKVSHQFAGVEFRNVRAAPFPTEKLTLAYYGLPDPKGTRWGWKAYLAAALAAVAIVAGVFLARRRLGRRPGFGRLPPAIPPRPGFTLIELIVTLAIIALLVGLLLPAVQRVREAAARAKCANNLRQIGLALHSYEAAAGNFPTGHHSLTNPEQMPYTGWSLSTLPYLEQQPLFDQAVRAFARQPIPFDTLHLPVFAALVPPFQCPADERVSTIHVPERNIVAVALTSYVGVTGMMPDATSGVLYNDSRVRMADIRDGTSNTLLVGERPPPGSLRLGWWYAGSGVDAQGSDGIILGVRDTAHPYFSPSGPPGPYGFAAGRLTEEWDAFHFWSLHPGGAHFAFADGSVHFLRYAADAVLPALATRAGGEAPVGWE